MAHKTFCDACGDEVIDVSHTDDLNKIDYGSSKSVWLNLPDWEKATEFEGWMVTLHVYGSNAPENLCRKCLLLEAQSHISAALVMYPQSPAPSG